MGEVGRGWERLGEVGRGWERLGEVGRGWERLGEVGRGWEKDQAKSGGSVCDFKNSIECRRGRGERKIRREN